jgi:hypothetical protein
MADNPKSSKRKKTVSHKRVAIVLGCLVATLTLSAGFLLALEESSTPGKSPAMMGTTINYIPDDAKLRKDPWNYIIVYQSGSLAASAADLVEGRLIGGSGTENAARPGANFHFVVDAASGVDGDIVKGSAWLRQEPGAPNVAWPDARSYSNPYTNAVGICLVGDVNRASDSQNQQLNALVRDLQSRLKIPASQVLFQWELQSDNSPITPAQRAYADSFRKGL